MFSKGDLVRIVAISNALDGTGPNDHKLNMLGNIYPIQDLLPEKSYQYDDIIAKGYRYLVGRNFFKPEELELVFPQ